MKLQSWAGILLSFFMASESFGAGSGAISNGVLSARSLGWGGVGVAESLEDPMTIYDNPAGLTSLKGTQVTLGGTWENLHGYFQNDNGPNSKKRSIDVVVPNLAVTQSFMDGKVAAGLAIYSAYGSESHWPGDGSLRYLATNSRLPIAMITPAVAYQVDPRISVGIGADYANLFNADLEKNVNMNDMNTLLGGPSPGAPDANSSLRGTAANWGYHAGVTLMPNEQNSVGVVYHSKIKLNVNGSVTLTGLSGAAASPAVFGGSDFTTSAYTVAYLPQNIQLGYAYKPNHQWTFEADTAWYDWFSDRDLNIRYTGVTATQLSVLTTGGAANPQPLNWRDAWSFNTGANYKVNERLQLRSGFWYQPWIEPESAFTPGLLDLSRYGLGAGAGYAFTPSLTVDLAYDAIFFHNRHISNNLATTADPLSAATPQFNGVGTYQNFVNVLSLNFTYKFK